MNQAQRVQKLEVTVLSLVSLFSKHFVAGGLRTTGDGANEEGVIRTHLHGTTGEGGELTYLPADYSDWTDSVPPANLWDAIDQLAARLTVEHEPLIAAVTMEMSGMEE